MMRATIRRLKPTLFYFAIALTIGALIALYVADMLRSRGLLLICLVVTFAILGSYFVPPALRASSAIVRNVSHPGTGRLLLTCAVGLCILFIVTDAYLGTGTLVDKYFVSAPVDPTHPPQPPLTGGGYYRVDSYTLYMDDSDADNEFDIREEVAITVPYQEGPAMGTITILRKVSSTDAGLFRRQVRVTPLDLSSIIGNPTWSYAEEKAIPLNVSYDASASTGIVQMPDGTHWTGSLCGGGCPATATVRLRLPEDSFFAANSATEDPQSRTFGGVDTVTWGISDQLGWKEAVEIEYFPEPLTKVNSLQKVAKEAWASGGWAAFILGSLWKPVRSYVVGTWKSRVGRSDTGQRGEASKANSPVIRQRRRRYRRGRG